MQHDLTVLTKRKEMICYYESFGYDGKGALDKYFYHSTELVYLQKTDQASPS
jgi:hypothetical protein